MRSFRLVLVVLRRFFALETGIGEFWTALAAIAWATASVVGTHKLASWPSMQILASIGGDAAWHAIAYGLGAAQLVCVALNARWLRGMIGFVEAWFWTTLLIGAWAATPWNPLQAVLICPIGISLTVGLRMLRPYGR